MMPKKLVAYCSGRRTHSRRAIYSAVNSSVNAHSSGYSHVACRAWTVGALSAITTATGPRPGVLGEARAAVFGLQRSADAILQIEQIGFDGFGPVVHEITLRMTARSP